MSNSISWVSEQRNQESAYAGPASALASALGAVAPNLSAVHGSELPVISLVFSRSPTFFQSAITAGASAYCTDEDELLNIIFNFSDMLRTCDIERMDQSAHPPPRGKARVMPCARGGPAKKPEGFLQKLGLQ